MATKVRKHRSRILKKTIHQALAERLLGKHHAHSIISGLKEGTHVFVPIGRRQVEVWWIHNSWHIYARQAISHVEMRDPNNWGRKMTYDEFLWTALGLLITPRIADVKDIRNQGCISIWSPRNNIRDIAYY